MKDKWVVLSATVIVLILMGGISVMSVKYASGRGSAQGRASLVWGGKAELRNVIELPLSDVESLTLEYGSKNIRVYPSEKDAVVIKEYLYSDDPNAQASVSSPREKEVLITGGKRWSFVIFGFWGGEGERIEVYIPEKSLKSFSVKTGSGNISSETDCVRADGNLSVRAGSGNLKWKNTQAGKISCQAGSGNLKIENLKGEIVLRTGSGNITGEALEGRIEAEAGSGNVHLENISGSGRMAADSGNVTVEAKSLTGDMALRAGSGNVKLEFLREAAFHFQADTGSGMIHTDFDERLSYNKKGNHAEGDVGDHPVCRVEAKTNSGNVKVLAAGNE